ncbi:NUDIX hydrolase [[Limnothrix rosea] IAM M-220]|uniref:NUDIX hydrolase n=1 Tax=[Limnothrix rosea] IAM M-220 TaxID=454133 RepID=UPI00095EA16A|nr:NUDIX domain-containing protein [[Limnothrix rosea] IAM M-220]OKH12487.1 NUDIX hydrolase [[Limnothrix rosea] IAM M-220]
MSYTYDYPKPSVTVDCVVFGLDAEHDLKIMLIQRGVEPYKGEWALPGGFVKPTESLEEAALRELKEETGVDKIFLEQLYTFGEPKRDPRDRVITVAYYALINLADHPLNAQTDADDVAWYSLEELPTLAFDHDKIVAIAQQRLQGKLRYEPIGFELLPKKFTLTQLQKLYEQVLGTQLDKRNFRRKILKMDLLIKLDEMQTGVAHRAARLYSFDEQKYQALKEAGFNFEL